ncbi:MAG: lysylphosphatidylglycerol synthase transmembrane domain-containing protein [Bacteroidota bacterium]
MKKKIFSIIKFIVPVVLLYYIFTIIDIDKLRTIVAESDPYLLSFIIFSVPLQYLFFTIRWAIIMRLIENVQANFFKLHAILYKGLFVGFFVPGGVGIDVYRVLKVKKEYGVFKSNVSAIFLEKVIGTTSSLLLVLACYPFINVVENEILRTIINYSYIFVGIVCFAFIIIALKSSFVKGKIAGILNKVSIFFNIRIINLINKISKGSNKISKEDKVVQDIFKPLMDFKYIFIVLVFSLIILVIKAAFMNIVFRALGYELPLVANLFVVPLVNIISLIPVSFGGVGVRETAYIVLYAYFGMPSEGSLITSLITFTFLLLNISAGGLLMLKDNLKAKTNED